VSDTCDVYFCDLPFCDLYVCDVSAGPSGPA
jgi:hypothetical protein